MLRKKKLNPALQATATATAAIFLAVQLLHIALHIPTASAQEEELKRVAVFVLPASDSEIKAALLMSRVLRENTDAMTNVELVTPAPVLNSSALPELIGLVDSAYRSLNAKNIEKAMGLLSQAKPLMEQILPVVPVRTVALFYKAYGVGQALSGNMAEARSALELSLTLRKEQSNLEYAYSVEVLQIFNSVSVELEGRPAAKLTIETQPENAVVVVDSREPAQSPATVTNLTVGAHLVRIVLDGHEQWAGFVRLKPNQENQVTISLKPIAEKAVFDQRLVAVAGVMKSGPEEAVSSLLELKQFLGANELLAIECSVVGETYELSGFHLKADDTVFPAKRSLARDASFLAGVREFLSGLFESFFELARKAEGLGGPPIDPVLLEKAGITTEQSSTVFDPDNPVFPTVDLGGKKKKKTLFQKWWFWTAVGVVAAGGLGMGLYLGKDSGSGAGPTGTIEINLIEVK